MENNLYIYNINMASRNELYNKAKIMATDLGYNPNTLRTQWRNSTKEFWTNKIKF